MIRRSLLPLLLLHLLLPASAAAQQPATPSLHMELESGTAVVGQAVTLRMTVLVPTWMPKPPEFPNLEATNVAVRLPEGASRPTTERVGNENWSGVVRAYRITPMAVGRHRFPSQQLVVTYADPESLAPTTVRIPTDAIVIEGVVPEGARGLDPFIAAEQLTLEQRLEGDPEDLEPGGAFTRVVVARAEGTSAMFLPPLVAPLGTEDLSAYPREPVLTETVERGVLVAERVERITYVAAGPGRHQVPPISLRWYDLGNEAIAQAETPGFAIVSRGPLPGPLATFEWQTLASVALALAFLGLLARPVAARLGPPLLVWLERRREARLASESHAFSEVTAALRHHDMGAAARAIEVWSARLPNLDRERGARIGSAMAPLGAALYGPAPRDPGSAPWSDALAALRGLRSECLAKPDDSGSDLPPLNPEPGR